MSVDAKEIAKILDQMEIMFPNAGCELIYHNMYELIVAVVLSAQTTDKAVNLITPVLFTKYPTVGELAKASMIDVQEIIKRLGLSSAKAKNIVNLAKKVMSVFHGVIPDSLEELKMLDGVGQKTANVVLSEGYHIPRIAVDTHVERVSKRLGIVDQAASVLQVEQTLMNNIPQERWHQAHHLLLFFGRYHCFAKKPQCSQCFYTDKCYYYNDK